MRGVLITLEGVEGSAKTTQGARLVEHLRRAGRRVVETSEPDGTPLGLAIRALFEREGAPPTPITRVFLFMAARQQHVAQVIRPALEGGAVVISDRYADATLAYQGYGQGIDLQTIRDLNALATGGVLPDLTLLLDLAPEAGMRRIGGRRLDAVERMGLGFHQRVREGSLEIARTEKRRVVVLRADREPQALHAEIAHAVDGRIETLRGGAGARGSRERGLRRDPGTGWGRGAPAARACHRACGPCRL